MSEVIQYQPGDVVIQEGDVSEGLYVLSSGILEVYMGDELITELNKPASIFGEMGGILGRPRTCKIIAKTECEVVHMSKGIDEIIRTRPQVARRLIYNLAERLDTMNKKLAGKKEDEFFCFEEKPD